MNTRLWIASVSWVVVLAAVPSLTVAQPVGRGGPRITFRAQPRADLIQKASSLKVYELAPPKLREADFNSLTERLLGRMINGKPVRAGQLIAISDPERPSYFLMLDTQNGYVSFDRGLAELIDEQEGKLPGEPEAERIARGFYERAGLAPGKANEVVLGRVSRIRSASFDPASGREGGAKTQALVVQFDRELDGVRVVGSGSRLIARIGDDGAIVGGTVRWREVLSPRRIKAGELRSVEQIQTDIRRFLQREFSQARSVAIDQVGLYYYDAGGRFIQPVIGYEATSIRGEGLAERYFGQTALLVRPVERVGPAPVGRALLRAVTRPPQQAPVRPGDHD